MIGAVVDLSLAHTNEEVVVVGAEDSLRNLLVHNVMEGSSDLFIERVVVGGNAAPADLVSLSTRASCDTRRRSQTQASPNCWF